MIKGVPFNKMNDYEFEQFKKEFDFSKWNEYKQNMECCIEILRIGNEVQNIQQPIEVQKHKSKLSKIYDILKE